MKINKLTLLIIIAISTFICGCYTPKGGSSIPWNQPQSWEGKTTVPGMAQF